jgi:hypothetical protein
LRIYPKKDEGGRTVMSFKCDDGLAEETRCDEVITDLIVERPAPCHLAIRHVEAERN